MSVAFPPEELHAGRMGTRTPSREEESEGGVPMPKKHAKLEDLLGPLSDASVTFAPP